MNVYISFTTIPDRLEHIEHTIQSLVGQSKNPDTIFLAIPRTCRRQPGRPYVIPDWLASFEKLVILREDEDYGPAMKLLPALKAVKNPDDIIVTVDDDHVYQPEFLDTLLKYSTAYPDSALGFNGWNVRPLIENSRYEFIDKTHHNPVPADVLEGYRGVLYKKRFFNDQIFDYSGFPKIAYRVDDVWISAHLERNRIEKLVLPGVYCAEKELPKGLHKRWSFKRVNRRMAKEFQQRGYW